MLIELRCKKCGRLFGTAEPGGKGTLNIRCYKSDCRAENVFVDNKLIPQIGFDRHTTAKNDLQNEKASFFNTTVSPCS